MNHLSEERAAHNEATFRELNERRRRISYRSAADNHLVEFICECSNENCTERVHVLLADYEAVRRNEPRHFLLRPGHQSGHEHITERHPTYIVVEKDGTAGRIAEQTDPRNTPD